jgi:hypothetical protein
MKTIAKITAGLAYAASALLLANASAYASVILFANLTTSQEPLTATSGIPPTNSSTGLPRPLPFGTATFVLNDAQTALTYTATIFNIDVTGSQTPTDTNDNLLNAHIHAGTGATPTFSVVWGFFGTPFNDNNPNDEIFTPFASGVGGTFSGKWDAPEGNGTTLAAQVPNILAGRSYINFHTTQNPGGEIRGVLVVPEPTSLALLGIGALGLFGFGLRRRVSLAS